MNIRCGYIALIGRPNVGKSTLLNKILQQKISITSQKPQTTRHSIIGIRTDGEYQYVYVDTPGINQKNKRVVNRLMNKTAINTLKNVDVIAFVVDGLNWKDEDEYVLDLIKKVNKPCVSLINKIDKIKNKSTLLPHIEQIKQRHQFQEIIPISGKKGTQLDEFQQVLKTFLPEGPHLFLADQVTDRPIRFLCSELLREKIFRLTGEELPYAITIEIEDFKEEEALITIHALILVDKDDHKRMIIGEKGSKLKEIASNARIDMEKMLGKKVFLKCWCKVKSGWSDNERLLKQLGYDY